MGKSYRQTVAKWEKSPKGSRSESMRRDMERKEKALKRSLATMKGMTRGFTLVELLVGIVIIAAILAGISIMGGCGYVGFHFLQKVW